MTPYNAKSGFTFGADPEMFITNADGQHVSAEGLIPGTKAEPFKVEGGAVQVDGMAAEFNIDPVDNFEAFNANIVGVMKQLKSMLPTGYGLSIIPSVDFSPEVFDAAPECAKELGCTPDLNAWEGDLNPPPDPTANPRTRCAGGHIHIGWTENADMSDAQHFMNGCDLVKQLDWYLGAWSVSQDKDTIRRSLYGKAGACRIKPYGVEYRVLSNFWLTSKALRMEVWNRTVAAINDMRTSFQPTMWDKDIQQLMRDGINTSNMSSGLVSLAHYPIANIEGRPTKFKTKRSSPSYGLLAATQAYMNPGPFAAPEPIL